MVARVTLAEIDAVRMSVPRAVRVFEDEILPDLHEQDGYEGCYVLTTPEGKALVMTFWADDAIVFPPASPAVVGSAAIREFVAKSFQTPGFSISWKTTTVAVSA